MSTTGKKVTLQDQHYGSSIRLTEKDLPEIKDWKVGEKYTFEIVAEQKSMRKEVDYSHDMGAMVPGKEQPKRPEIITAELKIVSIQQVEKVGKDKKPRY